MDRSTKEKILAEARAELQRHRMGTFVDNPPSVAQGGTGIVVPGCETCKKQAGTVSQFLEHLADDALPIILRRAFDMAQEPTR